MTRAQDELWTTSPATARFDAAVELPGSKSLTNRALILSALASGPCVLQNVLLADDTRHMMDNLRALGLKVDLDEAGHRLAIDAPASVDFAVDSRQLFCGNSGTTLRFLAALLAAVGEASFILTGEDRMKQRPAGPLADLLNALGGDVSFPARDGFPPLQVRGRQLQGGTVEYAAGDALSSQYLSAALMVAPYTRHETRIALRGAQTSWAYVRMTMRLMDLFGVTAEIERDPATQAPTAIIVPRGRYHGTTYMLEPDASAAGYFLALAAIHPGSRVTIPGLGSASLQGDTDFAALLRRMGAQVEQSADHTTLAGPPQLHGIDIDLSDMPDVAQTLAVVALFAVGETTLRGIHTLRVKETDRVAALQSELATLGAETQLVGEARELALRITPPPRVRGGRIATFGDHRMAMSFALAATRRRGIEIESPGVVSKTFPEFFDVLERVVRSGDDAPATVMGQRAGS
jgi:3-phosphoshikimate 1-carboxyvinyltransferase